LRELGGDRLRAAPLLLTVVDAELGAGNMAGAAQAAEALAESAQHSAVPALRAQAALGQGRVAAAQGERDAAAGRLAEGLSELAGGSWPFLRAALNLEFARVQREMEPASALVAAQAAFDVYAAAGAREAAAAADLLGELGAPVTATIPRPPTALDALSPREREVLSCLAEGRSNPEIAARLYITPKTAEHHVSSILGKLGLKNRAEAAAFAASFRISPAARWGRR
jgi:DNA-binding NarL/FixJ family response regulator